MNNDNMRNVEMERAILGEILFDDRVLPQYLESLNWSDFFVKEHQELFKIMGCLFLEGKKITILNIANYIGKDKMLKVGGISYLGDIMNNGNHVDSKSYIDAIKEASKNRRFRAVLNESLKKIKIGDNIEKVKEYLYMNLSSIEKDESSVLKDSELLMRGLEEVENNYKSGNTIKGARTGYENLDGILNGFNKGELMILGGRPSMGKTVVALNLAEGLADMEKNVLFFEMEMSEEAIACRRLSIETEINNRYIQNGNLKIEEFDRVVEAYRKLATRDRIFTDCSPSQSLAAIATKSRLARDVYGVDVIIIDYLTLMKRDFNMPEHLAIREMTRGLKVLSKELNVPILVLSQLSRSVEFRSDKRPILSDLRESGSIEEDADIVMFVYREGYYDEEKDQDKLEIIVAKNRNGETGTLEFKFNKKTQKLKAA